MKREELEKFLGKPVWVTLFDGETISGILHKTGEKDCKNNPNLYLKKNFYFCTPPNTMLVRKSLFRCSHVIKCVIIEKMGYTERVMQKRLREIQDGYSG